MYIMLVNTQTFSLNQFLQVSFTVFNEHRIVTICVLVIYYYINLKL
jgi:hypothetical protein